MNSKLKPEEGACAWPDDVQPGEPVLVSACLLGERTRYDGAHKRDGNLMNWLQKKQAQVISICPEVWGGLSVPRPAAELKGGDGKQALKSQASVQLVETGADVSSAFLAGAEMVVRKAVSEGARYAFLQERSPSCGVDSTYIDGELRDGSGVAAAALEKAGIQLISVQ